MKRYPWRLPRAGLRRSRRRCLKMTLQEKQQIMEKETAGVVATRTMMKSKIHRAA